MVIKWSYVFPDDPGWFPSFFLLHMFQKKIILKMILAYRSIMGIFHARKPGKITH